MDARTLLLVGAAIVAPTLLVPPAGPALAAALASLKARGQVAGASYTVDASSAARTFANLRDALPAQLDGAQLDDIMGAWLDAFSAGCNAKQCHKGIGDVIVGPIASGILNPSTSSCDASKCDPSVDQGPTGNAVCAVAAHRAALASSSASDPTAVADVASDQDRQVTLDLVGELANALDSPFFEQDRPDCPDVLGDLINVGTYFPRKLWGALGDALGSYAWIAVAIGGLVAYELVVHR